MVLTLIYHLEKATVSANERLVLVIIYQWAANMLTLWRPESEGLTGDHRCLLIYYGNHLWRWAGKITMPTITTDWSQQGHSENSCFIFSFNLMFQGNLPWMLAFLGWCFSWYERLIASDLTHIIKSEIFYHHPSQENWNWKYYLEENCFPRIIQNIDNTKYLWPNCLSFCSKRNLITFPLYKVSLSSLLLELLCNNNFILLVAVSALSSNKYFSLIYFVAVQFLFCSSFAIKYIIDHLLKVLDLMDQLSVINRKFFVCHLTIYQYKVTLCLPNFVVTWNGLRTVLFLFSTNKEILLFSARHLWNRFIEINSPGCLILVLI